MGPVHSHKGGFKPVRAFDPSSTSVAQTTHVCCRPPGFDYKLTKKFKFEVDGWIEESRKREAEGERAGLLQELSMQAGSNCPLG